MSDYAACQDGVTRIEAENGQIDVLVNNAGITRDMPFRMGKSDWDAVIRTNLDSVFNMAKQVMDGMTDRNWGRIVNVSSVNGQKGVRAEQLFRGQGRHAWLYQSPRTGSRQGRYGEQISPGYIGTKMVTAIREGYLEDKFAANPGRPTRHSRKKSPAASTFLVADDAGFITGACLDANGGQYMA